MDPRIVAYLDKNKKWAQSPQYVAPISFREMQQKGREREDGTVIVVACTDPRVTPEEFLGMDRSSKATVVRIAGGRVTAAMSSLLVLAAVGNNGSKGVIMVVHHTDCGLAHATDEQIAEILKMNAKDAEEKLTLEKTKFGAILYPTDSVKEDVQILKDSSFFRGMQIHGFVQDTETGILQEVICS